VFLLHRVYVVDVDKARKLGLDEFVQANPSKFMHAELFRTLQKLALDYRLNDIYTCLVRVCPLSDFTEFASFLLLFYFVNFKFQPRGRLHSN